MAITFFHSPSALYANTSRTLIYGPVPSGKTALIFAGTITNDDRIGKSPHTATLECRDNNNYYTPLLTDIKIPYGNTSKVPKKVLLTGESIYASADSAGVIAVSLEILLQDTV